MDIMRSLTIGLYMEQPITWLHRTDPRIKIFWLLSLLLSTILANNFWRLGIVAFLLAITLFLQIPRRIWKQQMGLLLLLAGFTFAIALFSGDALQVSPQPVQPSPEILTTQTSKQIEVPSLPQPTGYHYVIFKAGSVMVTQRSLDLAIRLSTLIFTAIYSPTLFLLVTAPEEFTAAIAMLLRPFQILGLPTVEISLTLTLALRFLPLVLEEIQNLVRAIATRAINWKKLGWRKASGIWLMVVERLISNLFVRAEQTANAMQVRGFTSPNQHQVKWHLLQIKGWDWVIAASLLIFWWLRLGYGRV
jgi:energy-coupling factor transport system permease protein